MIAARAAMSHKAVAIHIKNLKLWVPVPLVPLIFYPPFTVLGQDKYFIFRAPPLFTEVPAVPRGRRCESPSIAYQDERNPLPIKLTSCSKIPGAYLLRCVEKT
jgi:hypothetical protein